MGMTKVDFCRSFFVLNRKPMSFEDRPYLPPIYGADRGNLVIRASRQVEKSTFLANTIIHTACRSPDASILFVAPRFDQTRTFSHDRLHPLLQNSPIIRRALLGRGHRLNVSDMEFSNGARLHLRAAFRSADACRGLSANLLFVG